MAAPELLKDKYILAVDDEEDVLEVIREQLMPCRFACAGDFETARDFLENEHFDLVILDIMGVKGFDLLDIARDRNIPAIMLTAHALTPGNLEQSLDSGAVAFLPKEELFRLGDRVAEILEDLEKGNSSWPKIKDILAARFRTLWGALWDKIKFPKDGPS
jgi:CheY-like chemotaxis protein